MAGAARAGEGVLRGKEGLRHFAHLDEVAGPEAVAVDRAGPARRFTTEREVTSA